MDRAARRDILRQLLTAADDDITLVRFLMMDTDAATATDSARSDVWSFDLGDTTVFALFTFVL